MKTCYKKCPICHKKFIAPRKHDTYCSRKCGTQSPNHYRFTKNDCKKSVQSQSRRSKNETYFSKLCKQNFNNILLNKPIFNGWDADVILVDYKIAILWNGNWHYKKLTKKHSLLQTQNRDKIKIGEILKEGYFPYIIKDNGRFNKTFVESEFYKLTNYLKNI
jgi:hypothetical protein